MLLKLVCKNMLAVFDPSSTVPAVYPEYKIDKSGVEIEAKLQNECTVDVRMLKSI